MKQTLSSQLKTGSFKRVSNVLSETKSPDISYERLDEIVGEISVQTDLCERSLIQHNEGVFKYVQRAKASVLDLVGFEYEIPSIKEAFTRQLSLVSQYNSCLDVLIQKGESELSQLQQRVDELDKYSQVSRDSTSVCEKELDENIREYEKISSRQSRRKLIQKTHELGLTHIHTDISQTVLSRLDSLEQFLTDAVFTTKKLREEGRGYEHFLYASIQPYLALGINVASVKAIYDNLGTMKSFTDQVELHVADSLSQLQILSYSSLSKNDAIQKKAANLEQNRLQQLQEYNHET